MPEGTLTSRAQRISAHFFDIRPRENVVECIEELKAVLKKHKMYLIHERSHVMLKDEETSNPRAQFYCL